jgi:serine/threonine protein kinase
MSLISIMLADEPANRMTLAELLQHPWLNEDLATEEEVIEEMNQ